MVVQPSEQASRNASRGSSIVESGPDLRSGGRKFGALLAVLAVIAAIVGAVSLATGDDLRLPNVSLPNVELPRVQAPDLGLRQSQPTTEAPPETEGAKPPAAAENDITLAEPPVDDARPELTAPEAADTSKT